MNELIRICGEGQERADAEDETFRAMHDVEEDLRRRVEGELFTDDWVDSEFILEGETYDAYIIRIARENGEILPREAHLAPPVPETPPRNVHRDLGPAPPVGPAPTAAREVGPTVPAPPPLPVGPAPPSPAVGPAPPSPPIGPGVAQSEGSTSERIMGPPQVIRPTHQYIDGGAAQSSTKRARRN
jgi:hypothetical protein